MFIKFVYKIIVTAVVLFVLVFHMQAIAGFKTSPKKAQRCASAPHVEKQTRYYCPEGGSLVLTGSSHRYLKLNQRSRMLCAAHPSGGRKYKNVNCPKYFSIYNLTDVRSWAGPFCNWVYQYPDKAGNRQTYACLAPPRKKKD